ncbi:MAG: FtsX-like permease family protein [Gammaproteobacteria bacterium]|nr:FtsX-like permease family protein [Gammaproteobacteria bacterium]
MNTSLWIALRYLKTRRRQFAAFVTWVSVAGLALGVMVLTVVVSVMNGFDAELKERILGTVPHLIVESKTLDEPEVRTALEHPEIVNAFDFFLGDGMVTRNGGVNPVTIYGINATGGTGLGEIASHMRYGTLNDLFAVPHGIVLGAPLAAHLGLLPGDSVAMVITEPSQSGVRPRINRFELVGTYELGAVIDYSVVVVAMQGLRVADLERIGMRGVRVTLTDPMRVPQVSAKLAADHPEWRLHAWSDSYGELFQAIRLEKLMMFLLLLMVVAVASFSIVSGQIMVVGDKRADIAILRTMGASAGTILRVFLLQGVLVSSLGIGVGLVAGIFLAYYIAGVIATVEGWFGFRFLAGTYFVEVPSVIKSADLIVIAAISWALCLASAWLPAHRAALMNPLEGLHR